MKSKKETMSEAQIMKMGDDLMRQISTEVCAIELLEKQRDKEINEAKIALIQKYDVPIQKAKDKLKPIEKIFLSFMRQNQSAFEGDNPRSRECEWGTFGWRFGGNSVRIESEPELMAFVMKDQKENADCGTFKFAPNKEGIKRRLEEGYEVAGCILSGANRSFYELKQEVKEKKD